jgi:regulatory protein
VTAKRTVTKPAPPAIQPEALDDALTRAYRYLAARDRTIAELRRHLTRQGLAGPVVEACVVELLEQRYLNDERFARRFTEDRRSLDGWGNERIRGRLLKLGITADTADQILGEDAHEELDAAVSLLKRKLRAIPADDAGRARALGLLTRRGYDLDLAYDAVRRFTDGSDA